MPLDRAIDFPANQILLQTKVLVPARPVAKIVAKNAAHIESASPTFA